MKISVVKLHPINNGFLKKNLYPKYKKGKKIKFDRIRASNTKSRLEIRVLNLWKRPTYIDSGFLEIDYNKLLKT